MADAAPDYAALFGRQMQVQGIRIFGRLARTVARQPNDRNDRELALDLRQAALVRNEERGRPIDRLYQQLLVDRFALRIQRTGADALGGGQLVLLDQRAHPLPDRNAAVRQQRLGQRKAAFARRIPRVREQLPGIAREHLDLRGVGITVLRQSAVAA